jgi:class 3 adenylate cyclase/tetratricopeptide (TPR) repeat protein
MACRRCGSEVRPGQKFCAECGLALTGSCPSCGTPYEGSPKFCAECGTALAGEAPATGRGASQEPVAERRFVTVLFADLVGFTALSEQQDPEAVRELLSRYFEVARGLIEGYGGSVEKFIGDAVMAVWGAPVAREDDPERAVRAALDLVDQVRHIEAAEVSLKVRAAVLSGEAAVVPGRVGEGAVAGDIVNTASRLQSVASPGTVLVGEATRAATSAAIAYEQAGEQLLKGKTAPVAAWRALRVVARLGGEGREEGLEPPFVGREVELRLLIDQLHAVEREGKLRMVAVTGQAGIGKSRLTWELEKYLAGLAGRDYYWHQGRSPAYGEGVTFWALGEMVRRRARIAEGEDEASTRAKLRAALDEFVADPDERRWLEPALGGLLGIDEANWQAREQLFSAWRTFFERIAERGPTILAFEDLQWADDGMLDFIEHMLGWARDKPILIITMARPELLEQRPNFGVGQRALVALFLEPLADDDIAILLSGLVPGLGEKDRARIVERAEGIPLYAVEIVRSLIAAGHLIRRDDAYELVAALPELDVPPTLRALITSRLDRLSRDDRVLLQDAAVLGQVFSLPALSALTARSPEELEPRLRSLSQRELLALESDPRSPERGQYRFRQGLIREVALATLSKRERRAKHMTAARYFETIGDDELAGILAAHYLEAFRATPKGEEANAIAAQARVALRAAGDRAARLHSHRQALGYYEKASGVTFDDAEVADLKQRAAIAAWDTGELARAEELWRSAIESFDTLGAEAQAAECAAELASGLLETSRIDEAIALARDRLVRLTDAASNESVQLHNQLARGFLFSGHPEEALAEVSIALDVAEASGNSAETLQLAISKAWALGQLGRFREALVLLTGALQLADLEQDLWGRVRSRFNLAEEMSFEDPHVGLSIGRDGMAMLQQLGILSSGMAGQAAMCAFALGDLGEVFQLETEATELPTAMGANIHGFAALALALRGERDEARRRMDQVREALSATSSAQDTLTLRYFEACLALSEGDLPAARQLAREARDAYRGTGIMRPAMLAIHADALLADLGELRLDLDWLRRHMISASSVVRTRAAAEAAALALEGRDAEAVAAYQTVIDEWRGADLRLDLALTLLERSRLLPSAPGARAAAEEAAEIFTGMGAGDLPARIGNAPAAVEARPIARKGAAVR